VDAGRHLVMPSQRSCTARNAAASVSAT
jgi:hypothetical protein